MHYALCNGLDLRCCANCARNVDNHPGVQVAHTLKPAADPPRCGDWKAIPARAIDASHGRL